jgi:dephospho-CoA kinase
MLIIGLTGGVGSGKSTVSRLFEALGVPVIDADLVAREVVEPGEPALEEITAHFGSRILTPEGTLDRGKLREMVFADGEMRKELESILHPRIRARMEEHLGALDAPYAILSIPLLVETGRSDRVNRILVVDSPDETRIERACRRDGISRERAQSILNAQCSRAERLAVADDVIDNSGPPEDLEKQVKDLHRMYLHLAGGV